MDLKHIRNFSVIVHPKPKPSAWYGAGVDHYEIK